jgi:hypothetical protein
MALVDRLGREEESAAGAGLLLRRLGHGYNRGLRGANRQGKRLNSGSANEHLGLMHLGLLRCDLSAAITSLPHTFLQGSRSLSKFSRMLIGQMNVTTRTNTLCMRTVRKNKDAV